MASSVVSMPTSEHGDSGVGLRRSLEAVALPSILGMYAFAAATFLVGARMAHWYGNAQSALVLFPLVLIFGGLAQFYACTWAFQTRDTVAMAMHGTWGSFWTAYGILEILYASGRVVRPQGAFPELGFWFIAVAAITWTITAASRENKGMTAVLALLAIGSTLEAVAELIGIGGLRILAAYFLIASAIMGWYVASALMVRFGRKKDEARLPAPKGQSEAGRAA
jgi:uncharacterized protein